MVSMCFLFIFAGMLADREKKGVGVSLFTHEFLKTTSTYSNSTFLPNFLREPKDFLPPNRTEDVERAAELCGESYQCRFDYGMSLNRDMAVFTKIYYDAAVNIKAINDHRVTSCGVLETPRFGRKSTFLFTPGTNVAFECDQGFMLIGDPRRTCQGDGKWDPPVYGYTQCLRKFCSAMEAHQSSYAHIVLKQSPVHRRSLLHATSCLAGDWYRLCLDTTDFDVHYMCRLLLSQTSS